MSLLSQNEMFSIESFKQEDFYGLWTIERRRLFAPKFGVYTGDWTCISQRVTVSLLPMNQVFMSVLTRIVFPLHLR